MDNRSSSIAIHADGGCGIGLGHVTRCIGLAHALRSRGYAPVFLVKPDPALVSFIWQDDFDVVNCAPTAARLVEVCDGLESAALIIDSYQLGGRDLLEIGHRAGVLVCFDDKADRELPVDLLVNGSPSAPSLPYRTAPHTKRLLGPAYQIVRPEFTGDHTRDYARPPSSILVTVGGDDLTGLAKDLIRFLSLEWVSARERPALGLDFVVGPFLSGFERDGLPENVRIHIIPGDIRSLMLKADVAISAGGQTLYELSRCGVPTVAFCVGEDQLGNLEGLAAAGAIEYVGWSKQNGWLNKLAASLDRMLGDSSYRAQLGRRASELIDGQGARRVAEAIHDIVRSRC